MEKKTGFTLSGKTTIIDTCIAVSFSTRSCSSDRTHFRAFSNSHTRFECGYIQLYNSLGYGYLYSAKN